jgi:predicted metal-dependent hydrolase
MEAATIEIPDLGEVAIVKSDRAKYIRITIGPDQAVRLVIPKRGSVEKGRQFLRSKVPWIRRHLHRLKHLERLEDTKENLPPSQISPGQAGAMLVSRLEEMARTHGLKYSKVSIKNQKTKWGSCSSKDNINLNINLARLPDQLRDYVILHELVHTRFKNHGKEFWAELNNSVGGDAKELARKLRKYRLR